MTTQPGITPVSAESTRSTPRKKKSLPVLFTRNRSGEQFYFPGQTLDIGPRGMFIESPYIESTGQRLTVKVQLADQTIRVRCHVVWNRYPSVVPYEGEKPGFGVFIDLMPLDWLFFFESC
jgi:hypothetical protein